MPTSLGHRPQGKWTFDESVSACFADMLARSIPAYESMRRIVFDVGSRYVAPDTWIVDLGSSQGDALVPFMDRFGAANGYLGLEISAPMLAAARKRFGRRKAKVKMEHWDIRQRFPNVETSLALCVLTLQFIPVEYRHQVVQSVCDGLQDGGAFVLVEKVLGSDAEMQRVLVETYHALKRRNGYRAAEVEAKRRSLENVLVPLPAAANETVLRAAGFAHVECVWRAYNFAGWLCVK